MRFQYSTLAIALVTTLSLQDCSTAETAGFTVAPVKAVESSVAAVNVPSAEVTGVDVPGDVVSSDVVSSAVVPSTEAPSFEVSSGQASVPCSSCGAAADGIGESTYFDAPDSQPYTSEGDCTSCNEASYETLPLSPVAETGHYVGGNYTGAGAAASGLGRTFTILGGWDLEFANEDLNILTGFLDEIQSDRSQFAFSAALGRRHRRWLRTESEIAVRDYNLSSQLDSVLLPGLPPEFTRNLDVSVFSLMRNAILEWNNSSRFTPYGGIGIGVSFIDYKDEFFNFANGGQLLLDEGDDTVFTWQVIAGVGTQIRENVSFITEYRYFSTADVNLDNLSFFSPNEFNAQNLFFGMKMEF